MGYFNVERNPCQNSGRKWRGDSSRVGVWKIGYEVIPNFGVKIESLLAVVENAAGDVEKAAEAERRVTEELRQLGNEALRGWARRQAQRKEAEVAQQAGVQRKEKKTSIGRPGTARSK